MLVIGRSLFLIALLLVSHYISVCTGKRQCGKAISHVQGAGKLVGKSSFVYKKGNLLPKIVGGYDVGYYKYPWFAALQIEGDTICGGTLIGPNYVLTAAHCYDAYHNQKLENVFLVKMGVYNNCKKEPTQKVFKITNVLLHEKYKNNKPYYDIALLKLSGNATAFTPICLPPKELSDNEQEGEAWIAGYGNMVEGGNAYPCEMREGRLLMFDTKTCKDMLKELTDNPKELAYVNTICAGYPAGGVDSCQGDSGGPLMSFNSRTNIWQTIGVVSFGYGCAQKNAMGIYTDVSKYLGWIEEKSGIKAVDENETSNDDSNNNQENGTTNNNLNETADLITETFIKIYDHIMNAEHGPKEIVIRFKNKLAQALNATKTKIRTRHRKQMHKLQGKLHNQNHKSNHE